MNSKFRIFSTFLLLVTVLDLRGDPLVGDTLNVGSSNTFVGYYSASGAIGSNNTLSYVGGTLAFGNYNTLSYSGITLAIGEGNISGYDYYSLVVGSGNELNATTNSLVVGGYNYLNDTWRGSYIFGDNNYAAGDLNFLFGIGLISQRSHYELGPAVVLLGSYNSTKSNELFVVGNGTDADTRSNALEVYLNGDVSIPGGKLSLFADGAATPAIVLDPAASQITVNGQALLRPNESGYVGIGTTSPAEKLDVHGNLRVGTPSSSIFSVTTTTGISSFGSNVAI